MVSIQLLGGWLVLAREWGAGVLCGAWGYDFCLCYRSFYWRLEELHQGIASDLTRNTMYVLGGLLVIAAGSFVYSIWLCRPEKGTNASRL